MKKFILPYLAAAMSLLSHPVFSQAGNDTAALGLAGDNLDLYAVLDIFQKSKTIEAFEKTLNEQKTGINNLDLDLDKKVDFIKVVTKRKDSSFTFILQVAISETETQDVAVILVDKDKNGKVSMQIVGDKELYGKDYIVEPREGTPSVTANPGYDGPDPILVNIPATTTTVVVQSAPIVQYVYSPAYVPYVPPYYYGFYPPYFAAFTVMAVGIYRANNYYYHGHGHGYHNTNVIHHENNFNNYNGNRNNSDRVSHNNASGKYGDGNRSSNRPSTGGPSASTRPSTGTSNRPSTGGPSASTRPSTGSSNRASASTRPSTSNYSSGRTRSSGGGGFSGGGGGMRGGGGGRRR
ncbi:MAG: hypothetical protein ACXWCG_05640 [Flavitalea sp.]